MSFKKQIYSKLSMFLVLVFVITQIFVVFSAKVTAQSATQKDINAIFQGSTQYEDTVECSPTGGTAPNAANNPNAYVLGDSISYGLHLDGLEGKISEVLGGETYINYDGGRSITGPGSQAVTDAATEAHLNPHQNALDAADRDQTKIEEAGTVVIVLGTNVGDDPFLDKMNQLLTKLKGYNPNANYYWVDIGSNAAASATTWSERNKNIYENAASGGYQVISRYKAIFGEDKDPLAIDSSLPFPGGGDQIHGAYTQLSSAIVAALQGGSTYNSSVTTACTCPTSGSYALQGSEVAEAVWGYLINEMGFTPIQAAGVMGNIERESGFNPTIVNPSSGAYGLIQWLDGRLTGLENYASSKGKDKSDLTIQLEFMKSELEGSYKSAVLDPIIASNDLSEVTRIWLEHYEIPCVGPGAAACFDEELNTNRLPPAQSYLAEYGSITTSPGSGTIGCKTTGGSIVGGFSLPIDRKFFEDHPDWLTNPHWRGVASDVPVPEATPIYSMTDGVLQPTSGDCGTGVSITTDDGNTFTYCHGSDGGSVEGAKAGDRVSAGQLIMHSSYTGHTIPAGPAGTHLHLQISTSKGAVCPQPLFQAIFNGGNIPAILDLPSSGCSRS